MALSPPREYGQARLVTNCVLIHLGLVGVVLVVAMAVYVVREYCLWMRARDSSPSPAVGGWDSKQAPETVLARPLEAPLLAHTAYQALGFLRPPMWLEVVPPEPSSSSSSGSFSNMLRTRSGLLPAVRFPPPVQRYLVEFLLMVNSRCRPEAPQWRDRAVASAMTTTMTVPRIRHPTLWSAERTIAVLAPLVCAHPQVWAVGLAGVGGTTGPTANANVFAPSYCRLVQTLTSRLLQVMAVLGSALPLLGTTLLQFVWAHWVWANGMVLAGVVQDWRESFWHPQAPPTAPVSTLTATAVAVLLRAVPGRGLHAAAVAVLAAMARTARCHAYLEMVPALVAPLPSAGSNTRQALYSTMADLTARHQTCCMEECTTDPCGEPRGAAAAGTVSRGVGAEEDGVRDTVMAMVLGLVRLRPEVAAWVETLTAATCAANAGAGAGKPSRPRSCSMPTKCSSNRPSSNRSPRGVPGAL